MPSFFTSTNEFESGTPFSYTLEFAILSPIPFHAFDVLPIQSNENKKLIN
jgi:hypothetical protein